MYRAAKSIGSGAQVGSSRFGSTIAAAELSVDTVRRPANGAELRLVQLIKEYTAGHEDAHAMDDVYDLLYDEIDVNVMDADAGRSVLHWAVLHGQAQLAKALLEAGAVVNTFAKDGTTPLMAAVRKGGVELVSMLLHEGAHCDLINQGTGQGPLLLACLFCNVELVELLLAKQATADISWATPQGPVTILQVVAAKVQEPKPSADMYMEVVRALLGAGADPSRLASTAKQETLLHNAVARRQLSLMVALAQAGADVNVPTKDGSSPLMTAVRQGSPELVSALLDCGAELQYKNEVWQGLLPFSLYCCCIIMYVGLDGSPA